MIRLLLLILLFFLGYTVVQALLRLLTGPRAPAPPSRAKPPRREGEEMVQDPECGTFLPRSDAVSAVIRGERHYFCSPACRDRFADRS